MDRPITLRGLGGVSVYRLVKHFDMACAHFVPGAGKCARVHGHNYRITFCVEGTSLNEQQMLIDFRRVKQAVRERYDHRLLNDFPEFSATVPGVAPSTERVAEVIYRQIEQLCAEEAFPPRLCWVQVRETDEATAWYMEEATESWRATLAASEGPTD